MKIAPVPMTNMNKSIESSQVANPILQEKDKGSFYLPSNTITLKLYSPQEDVSIPSCLSVLSEPTDLFTIECEVLGDPKYRIGISSELGLTELLVQTAGKSTETKTTLKPGFPPAEGLVVVDIFTRERSVTHVGVYFTLLATADTFSIWTFKKSDVDSTQTNMDSNFCLDLDLGMHRGVGLVLGPDALVVGVPSVGKVGDQ